MKPPAFPVLGRAVDFAGLVFHADQKWRPNEIWLYEITDGKVSRSTNLQNARLLGADCKKALSGRAGAPSLLPTLSGTGALAVRDGTIKTAGVIQQVMRLLETAGATGFAKNETPFDRLSAHFSVVSGVATTRDLEFRSKDLDFDGQGTVGLGGSLKLDVLASFSKEVTGLLVAKTRALSVRVNDAGRLTVPLQIRGTLQAPRVQLDVDKVLKEGVIKQLKKEGTKSLLKKLFGK